MKFGKNMVVEIKEIENLVEMKISGVDKGIKITPTDFTIDLHRRKMEGVTVDLREEIDIIQGIDDGVTTGEDILVEYLYGDKISTIILAGTIAKKHLSYEVKATALEIGGINTNEQNKEYITIAIQKMLGTGDSIGGVVECLLPYGLDISDRKGIFSKVIHDIMPEVTAIQFGNGIQDARSNAKDYKLSKNIIKITFGPDFTEKNRIPCLAGVRDVLVESLLAIVLI